MEQDKQGGFFKWKGEQEMEGGGKEKTKRDEKKRETS